MTERDDLARVITENRSWVKTMSDGYLSGGQNTSEEIADAVLAAGWVSPAEAAALRQQRDEAAAKVARVEACRMKWLNWYAAEGKQPPTVLGELYAVVGGSDEA